MRGKASIGFYGGVGSVTGANFLLDTGTEKILIDCGLEQGSSFAPEVNARPFSYDPKDISVLVVTHAHADHIGRIPKLVRDGFRGKIYSTPPTKDLAALMLEDAYGVMVGESEKTGREPLYEVGDIDHALALWMSVSYNTLFDVVPGIEAVFKNAGHILGSATVTFSRGGKNVVFTGDIGNSPQPLLNPPEVIRDADYMVIESVYGNRLHEDKKERSSLLREAIEHTIREKGTLIIPAFSLERTQAMLFEINNFVEEKIIPPIPTFLDSPLAIRVTDVYRAHRQYLKDNVRHQIEKGDDIFSFEKLSFTKTVADSRMIEKVPGPKIIIAGSGMSHGGRVLTHEVLYLDKPTTTVLLVGYQTVGSIGRLLQDGAKKVSIGREEVVVRAQIKTINGYSGHADRDGLLAFAEGSAERLRKVFVVMGEERASLFLVQRLRDYLDVDAVAPEAGQVIPIEW